MSWAGSDNYPPGVTGNEPQLTGEWTCRTCGAVLPEEVDCLDCNGGRMRSKCATCHGEGKVPYDGTECPDGCVDDIPW
jgi:hypothetical protein